MDDHNNNEQPFRPAGFVPFSLRGMCEKVESTPEPASDAIEEHVEERTPYEYCIEIGCKADVCKKLGIEKLFTLGQTDSEQAVKRFKLVEQGDTTLLVATVYSQEPRKLHVAAGTTSTELSVEGVQIDPVDTNKAREAFIPVHLGVEVGYRLGVSTKGYYYHFKDNKLLHEYKIQDNNEKSWAFNLTQSTADGLSDELLSDHPFTTILLPWRALDQHCEPQHLLHSTEKLTEDTFNSIDAAWLEENALKVDLNAILAVQSEAPQPAIEPQPTEVIYVVKKGDKLEHIARDHDMTLSEILELNPEYQMSTRKNYIYPGDEIVVALEPEDSIACQQLHQTFYTVIEDDNLTLIAAKHGISLDALIEMNPYFSYSNRKNYVYPGDKIVVAEETVELTAEHIVAAKDNEYGRETWADIAQRCNIPAKKLLELNPCYFGNESGLAVGDCIKTALDQSDDDSKERKTLPSTDTCDVNLTDNTWYRYRDSWLTEYVKPIVRSLFPITSAVLRVATMRPKMNEPIKLCLARYALDEVPADERTLEEQIAANEEDQVKIGKHPISDALMKAYDFAPSRYQDTTPHTLTVRQIRDGYVYVYYAPSSHDAENCYEHASKLFEYKKTGENFEREGESTPYLPCQSLPGKAYIVYSERQWTERQKTQFTDEPDFRERATKTSGQVYSFLDLVNYNRTEQDTFIDFANLVADMDEGTAVQDGRFAGSVTPTQSDKAHQPVISNQSLLDTIDECAPVRADILILDDPIALVEDTLVVSGKHMADLVNWQNQNQNLQGLTQATAGFCHLQLKQSDPLAQELAKDPVKHAKAHVIISSSSLDAVNLESPSGQTFWMESLNNINQAMKKEGIVQSLPADLAYFNQMKQKRKWRGRVRMKEMNEYYLSSTVQETFLRTRLNWASNFTLALLDTVGPDPSCLFFDLYEEDHASQYIDTVTEWHTYLSPALNEQDRNKYNAQLRSQLALNNVMGSAMFAGVPEFKSFLAKLMDVVLSSYPNESFHQLASQVESEEALSDWLDKANAINLQSGRADQSAHVGALGAMFDAFTNDELANFTFFKKYVQVPYTNVQNSFLNAVAGKVENINVFSFNSWSTDVVLKEITEGWKHQSRFKMDVIMPMVLNNQLSGREVTLTPENKRQLLKLGGQYDEAMAGIAAVSKELEKSRLPQDRATLSTQIEVLEKEAKKISGSMGKHITFTDAAKKAIRVENIWQPMAQKGIDFATGNALTGVVIVLNFLALQQDYERILTSQNPSDSDTLTLVYRPLWLMESVVRVSQGYYQAQVREAFSLISSASKDIDNVINTSTIFHAIKGKDVALSKTLTKLLIFGVAAELTLVVAGAIESYQIYVYDFMPSSGKAKIAHGLKLAGTVSMTISGVLGLLAVLFKFTVASALSIASIGLQIFGGIIYSIGTAYLNYVQDDDISEWLKKTYWGDKNKWEGAQVWGNTLKGHEKAFDELSVIRNQPKLYTQPTLKTPGEVSEENADGAWLMLELPSELDGQKLRVDVLVYPDRDKLITPGKDYQFFHIDTLGLDGSRQWQAEWVKGYRPQPHKNEMWQEIIPQLPETKVLTPSQGKSLQTWQPTGDTQLLNLWLPRPWGPTGTWMFETCPAIMLVWYEYHLDKSTGKPKEGAVPHAFTLDLSLDTDVFGDTELSKSLKQVDIMKITDKDGFDAYNKAVSLARSIIAPNLLNVGY